MHHKATVTFYLVSTLLFFLVGREALSEDISLYVDAATVHRGRDMEIRGLLYSLSKGVVVVPNNAVDLRALATEFARAFQSKSCECKAHSPLSILSTGPILDAPDKVIVRSVVRNERVIDVQITHTQVRRRGVRLRRNLRWRPLVEMPLKLAEGQYQVNVKWIPVESVPDGDALDGIPKSQSFTFEVVAR